MLNKPSCVLEHLRNQVSKNGSTEYTVSQAQPGHFIVQDKKSGAVPYIVLFGDGVTTATTPCCGCIDWLKYKLPCSHMLAIFHGFQSWDTLSPVYIENPIFKLDFTAFDKQREEELINTIPMESGQVIPIKCKEKATSTLNDDLTTASTIANTGTINPTPSNMSVNKLLPLVSSITKQVVLPLPVASRGMVELLTTRQKQQTSNTKSSSNSIGGEQIVSCENVCQELSNVIKHVDNPNMLKKVQTELQFVLNDVKMELSRLPSPRPPPPADDASRIDKPDDNNEKVVAVVVGDFSSNSSSSNNITSSDNSSQTNKRSHDQSTTTNNTSGDHVDDHCQNTDGVSDSKKSKMAVMAMEHHLDDDTLESDVWLHDAELEIKLFLRHREQILNNDAISHEVIMCAQKVLRHQFHDVTGFTDPRLLEMLTPAECFGSEKKVLQLHSVEEGRHWAVSARVGRDIRIFCCTLSSKASIIQQVLKLSSGAAEGVGSSDGEGDSILFIQRSEENTEHSMRNCSLHAMAYCVAFAFDIEARSMLFDENELRAHFAECLEDMCFSMFPSLKS